MKQIRLGVFETNSSSTHSVTINGGDNIITPKFLSTIHFGEYGWDEAIYVSVEDKLSYVITLIGELEGIPEDLDAFLTCKHYVWLKEMVFEHCGLELRIGPSSDTYSLLGYVDHQSLDTLEDFWSDDEVEFKTKMKDFIFNEKYGFETDNDNH